MCNVYLILFAHQQLWSQLQDNAKYINSNISKDE